APRGSTPRSALAWVPASLQGGWARPRAREAVALPPAWAAPARSGSDRRALRGSLRRRPRQPARQDAPPAREGRDRNMAWRQNNAGTAPPRYPPSRRNGLVKAKDAAIDHAGFGVAASRDREGHHGTGIDEL